MFVTIITIILFTIAFVLWAIIYGGSQNVSGTEQKFDNDEIFENYFWVMVATIDENSILEYIKIHCK